MKLAALLLIIVPVPLLTGITTSIAQGPEIRSEDVERFYAVYDAADGKPTADQLRHGYLDAASPGLVAFAKLRNITAERMATAIADQPAMFADARRCTAVLPAVKARLAPLWQSSQRFTPRASIRPSRSPSVAGRRVEPPMRPA